MQVKHNAGQNRFEYETEGKTAVLEYVLGPKTITYTHTLVPRELENRGIASALTKAAVEYGRSLGLELVPACSYVDAWLRREATPEAKN